jgi:hypothetical protein
MRSVRKKEINWKGKMPEGEKWADIKGYPWEKRKKVGKNPYSPTNSVEVGRRLEISAGKEG